MATKNREQIGSQTRANDKVGKDRLAPPEEPRRSNEGRKRPSDSDGKKQEPKK